LSNALAIIGLTLPYFNGTIDNRQSEPDDLLLFVGHESEANLVIYRGEKKAVRMAGKQKRTKVETAFLSDEK